MQFIENKPDIRIINGWIALLRSPKSESSLNVCLTPVHNTHSDASVTTRRPARSESRVSRQLEGPKLSSGL